MELTLNQMIAVAAILLFASVIQGAVGFASGLFGIPLMMMAGLSLPAAVTVNLVATFLQCVNGTIRLRHELHLADVVKPAGIRLATMPLGVYALWLTDGYLPQERVKQIVGVVLLGVVLLQWLAAVEPRPRLHPGWDWSALSVSGFINGYCGMGGGLLVLWVMAHSWSAVRSRALLFSVFLVGIPVQGLLLLWAFGAEILRPAMWGMMGIVIVVAGTSIGLHVGGRLPKPQLRRLIYVLLTLTALSAIVSPLVGRRPTAAAPPEAATSSGDLSRQENHRSKPADLNR